MKFIPLCFSPHTVFDNRNKLYGAYVLRKNYISRLVKSMAIAIIMGMLLLGGPTIFSKINANISLSVVKVQF